MATHGGMDIVRVGVGSTKGSTHGVAQTEEVKGVVKMAWERESMATMSGGVALEGGRWRQHYRRVRNIFCFPPSFSFLRYVHFSVPFPLLSYERIWRSPMAATEQECRQSYRGRSQEWAKGIGAASGWRGVTHPACPIP